MRVKSKSCIRSYMNKEKIDIVIEKARAFYNTVGNSCGGYLHIVLDDGNMLDNHIRCCREILEYIEDAQGVELCDLLLSLTIRERLYVYSRYDDYA